MDIGFDTIGNAIVIAYDRKPVLVTDPWLSDRAYFGSWTHSHEIPEEQRRAVEGSQYVWVSHGHPDHLDSSTIKSFKGKSILLPDHVGARIANDLKEQGHKVTILTDRRWYELSKRIRVLCISDYNQDAILLIDIGGRLVVNLNDASNRGWEGYVRKITKRYSRSFLLALSSRLGDADMLNFLDEDGERIPPRELPDPLGRRNARRAEALGVTEFVPFSSMHRYQRSDAVWADPLRTTLADYHEGFESQTVECLPAFIRYDSSTDICEPLNPAEREIVVREPAEFGDHWDEMLEPGDVDLATRYFREIEHLSKVLGFINLKVGGKDHHIQVGPHRRGITFEAPRKSLMTAIQWRIFDDMLIGNFMRTTLHGEWGPRRLYPDFTPYVAKYADNGLARTDEELKRYMRAYRSRAVLDHLKFVLEQRSEAVFRSLISDRSAAYRVAKRAYWFCKRAKLT